MAIIFLKAMRTPPRIDLGLDTNITKNRLNMFPEIPDFFLKISKFFSKYLEKVLNTSKISGFMSSILQ